jgi:hypothetical protein
MEPSALYKHTAVYAEQDNCLFFALGLAKTAADFRRLAETTPAQPAEAAAAAAETGGPAEDFELFLLGLLSFSRRYTRVMEGLNHPASIDPALPPADPAGRTDPPVIRELLR